MANKIILVLSTQEAEELWAFTQHQFIDPQYQALRNLLARIELQRRVDGPCEDVENTG